MARAFIAGYGYHHPESRVTNADLVRSLETTSEWIESHTGILERRRAMDGVDTSDLGAEAVRRMLDAAGSPSPDVELLICATSTPDTLAPATASWICEKLGLDAVPFDMNASCSGFIYGLAVAEALMATRGLRRVILCAAEKYSRVVDHGDGVPAADRDRMFAPFQRLDDRTADGGLGLGLAIARGFTEAMGGRLTPADTPGGGLTMTVTLPRAAS